MAGLYRDPPIPYKRAFDSSRPKLVTLTVYNAQDQEDSVKVPLFTDSGGLEELLHTEEAFRNAARDLELPVNKHIRYLGRCLSVDAQTKWRSLTKQGYSQTLNGYKQAFSAFIKEYCSAEDAKDIMHTYLRSSCKKPSDVSCRDHSNRMDLIMKYTAKLQGYAADLNHLQQMTILLHSFPSSWIEDYCRIHRGIREHTTVQFIVDHMSSLDRISKRKSQMDNPYHNPYDSDINSVSNQSTDSNNSESNSDNNSNADSEEESDSEESDSEEPNQTSKRKYNNPCRLPGHDHDWSECPKNRYSRNQRNKSNSSNNSTASAPSNENGSTASNESYQAHIRHAMESYCSEYGGRIERNFDGSLTWQP